MPDDTVLVSTIFHQTPPPPLSRTTAAVFESSCAFRDFPYDYF